MVVCIKSKFTFPARNAIMSQMQRHAKNYCFYKYLSNTLLYMQRIT